MTKEELGLLYPITVKAYDPSWPEYFLTEKAFLEKLFSPDLRIEHMGSTAVPGLMAKPTIDILMEQPAHLSAREIINIFEDKGYIYMKEQKNRLIFVKGYTPTGLEDISYHIHLGSVEDKKLWQRLSFRDALIKNEEIRREYTVLKNKLAKKYRHDREAYTSAKADFVKRVTEENL